MPPRRKKRSKSLRKLSLKNVAQNFSCPFLVTHSGNDRVVPCENAQKLYDAVGSARKTIKIFTAEEGGAEHAHVDNRQVGHRFFPRLAGG
jgi:esterase/lipase